MYLKNWVYEKEEKYNSIEAEHSCIGFRIFRTKKYGPLRIITDRKGFNLNKQG